MFLEIFLIIRNCWNWIKSAFTKPRIGDDRLRKQRRDRKQQKNDSELHYGGMAEGKPDEKAMERFKKPAYEVTDVIGYMAKKYDIKGEMRVENK